MYQKPFIFGFILFFAVTLSFPASQASQYFDQAVKLSEKGQADKALEYYLKAYKARPDSGFYAARVGQHYLKFFQDYSRAMQYYDLALTKGFTNQWVTSQMIKSLEWLGDFAFADSRFSEAAALYGRAEGLIRGTGAREDELDWISEMQRLSKMAVKIKKGPVLYTHRIVMVLIQEIKTSTPYPLREKMLAEEKKYSRISMAFLKNYIRVITGNRIDIDYEILEWTHPLSSLEFQDSKKFNLDMDKASMELKPLLNNRLEHIDTVVAIWGCQQYQDAHGGGGKYYLNQDKQYAWRGRVYIPSLRMLYNGPHLLVHEFFHTIENMMDIRPRHGYRPENRGQFPEWKGSQEMEYYRWQLEQNIPRLLETEPFNEGGWTNFNFKLKYPVRNVK